MTTTGSGLSKMFDIQNRRFRVVSCTNCGYSELYKGGNTSDMVDLFLG
ncbi:nucleic acid-binding protein [Halobacteriales archaeon SW_7_65_23]|nr:MAG: nucleic acid-binding protein [Halobacteriales archaeon SW_7_65_23]